MNWKSTIFPNLNLQIQEEWNGYIQNLKACGFTLNYQDDILYWSWNTSDGSLFATLDYEAITTSLCSLGNNWWYRILWKWNLPLKLKLFGWCCLENKILTADNYEKKGEIGPNICILCYRSVETVDHLLIHCHFT